MGPGFAIKAVAGRHFSLMSFGLAQVAMDIEPLVGMIRGAVVLHGVTHTYLAALIIALVVIMVAPPVCRPFLVRWNKEVAYYRRPWLAEPADFRLFPVAFGALIGTFSHVALDSLIYGEMRPLAPWSDENSLLGLASTGSLTSICLALGAIGFGVWLIRARCQKTRNPIPLH